LACVRLLFQQKAAKIGNGITANKRRSAQQLVSVSLTECATIRTGPSWLPYNKSRHGANLMSVDFIFRGSAESLDPELSQLVAREDRRQEEKVILIASESIAPGAVRELMGSSFGNIYAEGYPRPESRLLDTSKILDMDAELAHYHRYGDPRYYKGVEYADVLEALARRRAAELFAANGVSPHELYVNVQPLSGSPANLSVYAALATPGDTIMGLHLNHGGHLTHGSRVSRSGKTYNSVSYTVDTATERLDYDAIESLALEVRPRVIVAGYTAYPMQVDWRRFKAIAEKSGAYLMADIAHISGLVAAGVHPSPIGIADVVTTTTHKSLCGPRGAMIMTERVDLARQIDRAVFPGEQGGPHLNTIAALALALKLAKSDQFRDLQVRVVRNASRLAQQLADHGLRIVAGGTENHLLLIDTKSISHEGVPLSGEMAARILDVAGIVTNSNTIPGDKSAFRATGIRLGTVWISQMGYGNDEVDRLAETIATVLHGCQPFSYEGRSGKQFMRAKISHDALRQGRTAVAELSGQARPSPKGEFVEIRGTAARHLLDYALTSDVIGLANGDTQATHLFGPNLDVPAALHRASEECYYLQCHDGDTALETAEWLQDLSDGYVLYDDLYGKLPGPIVARTVAGSPGPATALRQDRGIVASKPYFLGQPRVVETDQALPAFAWEEVADPPLQRTKLHGQHLELGGRMIPFSGWDMPVWYTSVSEEHAAVRETAGLFDVSHMGVLEARGANAADFLNIVTTNDIRSLRVGRSHYTYLLFPDGSVVDDLLVYRRGPDQFILVVNAANNDKDFNWLTAVNEGKARIDLLRTGAKIGHQVELRDLRDPKWADERLVDIALQGPRSLDILLAMCDDTSLEDRIRSLPWAGLTEGTLCGIDAVISRTGYTGERIAYELFVHPERSPDFWQLILDAGSAFGIKPCGLAARDSTRTEAGLPLYNHELAGPLNLSPASAGFGSYVKLWKPFFVGRTSYIEAERTREQIAVRFRMDEKGVRRPELGDPILDKRGKVVGTVTSCAIDREGYLLGQGVVPQSMATPGTSLAIYQLGGGKRKLRVPDTLAFGSRLPVPDQATVLSRFPSSKK
jgi:glycine hydroxymethyltransferase